MNIFLLSRQLLTLVLILWSITSFASGSYSGPNRDDNGNIIPTPKGEQCVEPIADMRANHMKYLLHKRDETVHDGIRTKQHSLVECINCHVTPDNDGKIARIYEERHFCASCHRAVSVKLDCFECHADRPVSAFSEQKPPADHLLGLEESIQELSIKPHAAMSRKVQ